VFGRFLADRSEAILVEDEATFDDVLNRAAADPMSLRRLPRRSPVAETAAALSAVVDDVMQRPAGFVRWPRFRQVGGVRPDAARVAYRPVLHDEAVPAWAEAIGEPVGVPIPMVPRSRSRSRSRIA
jgi:hypothetical protein